jgi:diacylglycerol kinase (ATP)
VTTRAALLVNPTSGKGRHARSAGAVADYFESAGWDVARLQGRDGSAAADLARQVVDEGYEILVVMGGDGLVHLALQSLAWSTTTLGIIPTGTGNDVARYLNLPRSDPLAAAAVVTAGHTRTIDLARTGTTYYATVLASGFDSMVNERANAMPWPKGQLRYNLATLAELRVFNPVPYSLEMDGVRWHGQAMLVAVGNGPSYGGGLRMCEGALLDDGLLDVVIIKPLSRVGLLRVYPRLFKGTHVTHPSYEHHRVKTVSIAAPGVVGYADGERLGRLPLTIDAAPAAVAVFAPVPVS